MMTQMNASPVPERAVVEPPAPLGVGSALTYRNKGVYTVRLTVSDGHYQATARPIVVQVGVAPTLIVSAPVDGALYRAGDTITYNAAATDAAGFDLDDTAITTEVRFRHGSHFHPFLGPLPGRVGSFTIPTTGEAAADTWYEILVTATDTNGLSTTRSVAIRPRIAQINLVTEPAGLGLVLDGVPVSTPLKSVSGSPMRMPPLSILSSRMASSWPPPRFLITEMALRSRPAASKKRKRMITSAM